MSKPLVKCPRCGEMLSREREDFVKIKTRYYHAKCAESLEAELKDYRELTDLIQELYKPDEPNWGTIGAQLKRYKNEGMTYKGMFYTLTFFFTIKGNSIQKGAGVGIIPHMYKQARAYYQNMDNTYTKAAEVKATKDLGVEQTENIVIVTQKKREKKLLDFDY